MADLLYVGKSTNRKFALFGIKTIGDLARTDEDVLNSHLGKIGSILWSFANGYDDSTVKLENTHAPIKSVGNSTTTPKLGMVQGVSLSVLPEKEQKVVFDAICRHKMKLSTVQANTIKQLSIDGKFNEQILERYLTSAQKQKKKRQITLKNE